MRVQEMIWTPTCKIRTAWSSLTLSEARRDPGRSANKGR